jgi:hypothetical protein
MTRASARRVFAGIGAVTATLVLATGAIAGSGPTWSTPIDVRVTDKFVHPTDVASSGNAIVAVWNEGSRIGFKTSDDAGSSFHGVHMISTAQDGRAAICGSLAKVVFAEEGEDGWAIGLATGSVAGGPLTFQQVAASSHELREPDVACTSGRIFVSWRQQTTGENARMWVASARLSDGVFGAPTTLGLTDLFFPAGLVLAAANNKAYAAFVRDDGPLRVKRWTIGAGPGYPLSTGPAVIIGPGTGNRAPYDPEIDASGERVAVTWGKCSSTLARVSTDAGATWGTVKTIEEFGCNVEDAGSSPTGMAVRGSRLALTYAIFGIPNAHIEFLTTSTNGFNSFDTSTLGEHQNHLAGFVTVSGETKLFDVYSNSAGHRIKFRRQV